MKKMAIVSGLIILLAGLISTATAQGGSVTVPDVAGLRVPQAAAVLNENGLQLGTETAEEWSEETVFDPNTIRAQSIAAGSTVDYGTVIDVTVLRSPNVTLVYNPFQLSLINGTGAELDLRGIRFEALDGGNSAAYAARDLASSLAPGNRCIQLWATRRTGPERPPGCAGVQNWYSTVNQSAHFWTDSNSVTQFRVLQDGIERAICAGAVQGEGMKQCAFYVPGGAIEGDTTAYVYLAYTTEGLAVINRSDDQWMPVVGTTVSKLSQPTFTVSLGNPEHFGNPVVMGDIRRLAPHQCLFYATSDTAELPQDCNLLAELVVEPRFVFWQSDFEIIGLTDNQAHRCLGAAAGKLTICVMPR